MSYQHSAISQKLQSSHYRGHESLCNDAYPASKRFEPKDKAES